MWWYHSVLFKTWMKMNEYCWEGWREKNFQKCNCLQNPYLPLSGIVCEWCPVHFHILVAKDFPYWKLLPGVVFSVFWQLWFMRRAWISDINIALRNESKMLGPSQQSCSTVLEPSHMETLCWYSCHYILILVICYHLFKQNHSQCTL